MATKKTKYLKLSLRYEDPDYSRTVVVPANGTLALLHEVIQASFGWLDGHLYQFEDDAFFYEPERDPDVEDFPKEKKTKLVSKVKIDKVLANKGDKMLYVYDFGDWNEVKINCVGETDAFEEKDFKTKGVDLIEDSAGMGFTPGIVALLSGRKSKKQQSCLDWLKGAWGKSKEDVLREPTAKEIFGRVQGLVFEL